MVIQNESAFFSSGVEVFQSLLSADILVDLLFKKQRCHIFCWGRAKSENVPSTPGVPVVENQGLLHGEERHRLFQKLRCGDSVMKVFFQWWLQFLHLAETLSFPAVEFTPAKKYSVIHQQIATKLANNRFCHDCLL